MTLLKTSHECLDEALAIGFVESTLSASERQRIPQHLAGCEDCRAWIVELVKLNSETTESVNAGPIVDPFSGTQLGRYQLVSPLGSGAAGLVYKAFDPALDRFIAIKLLRTVEDKMLRVSLIREAKAMAKLSHPNIVSIFDVGQANGELYIAMELVDAGTLTHWLAEKPRNWREIIGTFIDIGKGLHQIHEAGFVHRDIKPDNLLITNGGNRALVGDLGLSGMASRQRHTSAVDRLQTTQTISNTGCAVGTPAYMAPEVIAGKPATSMSDQFSYCRSLYQALTGHLLDPEQVVPPKTMREVMKRASVPSRCILVITRGLSPTPTDRFPSMLHLIRALQPDPPRRHYLAIAIVFLGLVAIASLFYFVTRSSQAPSQCAAAQERIDEVWNPVRLQSIQSKYKSKQPGESIYLDSFISLVNPYVESLRSEVDSACKTAEKSASSTQIHTVMLCLEQRRTDLGTLLDILETGNNVPLDQSVKLAAQLTPVSACLGEAPFLLPPPPPALIIPIAQLRSELRRAEVALKLGLITLARKHLSSVLSLTYQYDINYPPFNAEHAYVEALMQLKLIGRSRARSAFLRAAEIADQAGHDRARASALTALVALSLGNYEEGVEYGQRALAVLERINAPSISLASVESTLAEWHYRHGQFTRSQASGNRALQYLGPLDAEYPELVANVLDTLAIVESDSEKALTWVRRSLRLRKGSLGKHPDTVRTLAVLSEVLRANFRAQEALQPLQEALALEHTLHGASSLTSARLLTNLCITRTDIAAASLPEVGHMLTKANSHCNAAIAIYKSFDETDSPGAPNDLADVLSAQGRLKLFSGEHQSALSLFEKSLRVAANTEDDPLALATTNVGIANCLLKLDRDLPRAVTLAESAQPIYQKRQSAAENQRLDQLLVKLRSRVD